MRLEAFFTAFAIGLSVAQTTYNNGQWNPTPTTATYQSWTTWTSMRVDGTVTVTITSSVPYPSPVWVTTTQLVESTPYCNECQPVSTIYDTWPTTTYWYGYSTPATTTYTPLVTTEQQQYTTVTSGTVVYIIPSTTAAAGQVTTNGVVAVISAGAGGRREAGLVKPGLAVAGAAALALAVV